MPVVGVVAVAGVFWCRWSGCGWGVLVRVRCPWLGLDRAVAFSGLSRVGAVRMAGVSCACFTWLFACSFAWLLVYAHAPNDDAP